MRPFNWRKWKIHFATGDGIEFRPTVFEQMHIFFSPALSQEDRNSLEEKHSLLKNEFVAVKEALEKSRLEGDLVKQEKHEFALALEQVKLTSAFPSENQAYSLI